MSRAQMMNTIRLMAGSEIRNLTPETLTVDPTLTGPRFWFNSTEMAVKFGYLDASDQPVIVKMGDTSEVESALTGYIDQRISDLGAAFSYRGYVDGNADEGTPTDLNALYAPETPRAGDYYKVQTAGWFVLAGGDVKYANAQDGILINATGSYDVIDNSNTEIEVATGSEGYFVITGNTDTGFDLAINPTFETQLNAVFAAVDNLNARVGLDGNGELPSGLVSEFNTNVIADILVQLNNRINSGNNSQEQSVNNLVTNINNGLVRYESTAAATSHVISHDFGVDVAVSYWVKDPQDGKWYNDQVSVQNDQDQVTLSATEAFDCLVFVRSQEPVSTVEAVGDL